MSDSSPTWREVDGDVVRGRQRLIFVREHHPLRREDHWTLTPLACFADGLITWNFHQTDFDGLREALADGTVTLEPPAGITAAVPGLGAVTVDSGRGWMTVEKLLGDIADELDRLNDRPDSSRRAYRAFLDYAADPTDAALEAARAAYLAVPEHRRIYMLGDMDRNDVPARILLAEPGDEIPARAHDRTLTVTAEAREQALDYFRRQEPALARWRARKAADGPETATTPPVRTGGSVYPQGWPDPPGLEVLQYDYPATVIFAGREYRSVAHAYWALSTSDPQWHDRIAAAGRGHDAQTLAGQAPRRDGWAAARLAVMAALLRDRFRRDPAATATLLSTADARILSVDLESRFWCGGGREGTNWMGRLLELVRSELAAEAIGIPPA